MPVKETTRHPKLDRARLGRVASRAFLAIARLAAMGRAELGWRRDIVEGVLDGDQHVLVAGAIIKAKDALKAELDHLLHVDFMRVEIGVEARVGHHTVLG